MELSKICPFQPFMWILTPSLIKIFVVGIVEKVVGKRAMALEHGLIKYLVDQIEYTERRN